MIVLEAINDVYGRVICDNDDEFMQLYEYFKVFDESLKYTPAVRSGLSDGKVSFVKYDGEFYLMLKDKIKNFCKNNNIEVVDNIKIEQYKIDDEEWNEFIEKLHLPFKPYEHQIRGARLLIENRRHIALAATGAGKSLMIFIIIMWFIYKGIGPILLIVPDVGLVEQMYSDIYEYFTKKENDLKEEIEFELNIDKRKKLEQELQKLYNDRKSLNLDFKIKDVFHKIYSGQDKYTDHFVKITTWQSVYELSKTDYFDEIMVAIYDEVHKRKRHRLLTLVRQLEEQKNQELFGK